MEGIRGNRYIVVEISMKVKLFDLLKELIFVGIVIVLDNIYYDFNKLVIWFGEVRDLKVLVKLMKCYFSMEIELGVYIDSRGENDYNLKFFLKWVELVKEFLFW